VSNQGLSRDGDGRPLRPRSEDVAGMDQPIQAFDDVTLPSLYPDYDRGMERAAEPQERVIDQAAVARSTPGYGSNAWLTITKFNQFLYWLLAVLEVWFLLRFFLELVGARADNPFASFLYSTSYPLLLPFHTILPNTQLPGTAVIEWSTLIGMLVYALVIVAVVHFLRLLVTTPQA
jgi:uncharacterized protein YggT (Ycf19 family)